MRFTDCCSRCRVAHMTKHIIYVLQREYIFYCIVIIEKGTNSPTHINLSVIPTGWVLVSYTHKAITEECLNQRINQILASCKTWRTP